MDRPNGLLPSAIGLTTLFHVTTPKKAQRYHVSGRINAPVRGFSTLQAAMAWGIKTGRTVVYQIDATRYRTHKMPDHHNRFGEAWWIDADVPLSDLRCAFSPRRDA